MGGFIGATNLRASKNGVNVGSRSKVNFVEGANVTLTITDDTVNDEIDVEIAATSGGLSDGDKGDITVSGSGATWTIDANAVTFAKMQALTAARILGRTDASGGNCQEISIGSGLLLSGTTLSCTISSPPANTDALTEGSTNLYFSNERAQDAVGAALTDTATIDFTYDDATNAITADVKASSISTTQLADDGVTYAKIQNVSATDRLLGRSTAGAGDIEEITCTSFARTILDDANAAAARTTLELGTLATQSGTFSGTSSGTNTGDQTITLTGDVTGSGTGSFAATIATNAVSNAKFRQSAGLSLIGRSANTTGDVADITSSVDGHVLRQSGTALGFGTIATAGITDANVTYAKIQNIAGLSVMGRASNTLGVGADITAGSDNTVLRRSGTTIAFGTVTGSMMATNTVTATQLLQIAGLSILGRSASTTGNMAAITGTANQVLRVDSGGTALGFGTIATAGIADDAVTYAKIQNVTDARLLGRSAGSAGDCQEITVGAGLTLSGGALTAANGAILQVQQTTKTDTFSSSSTSYTDVTGMSVSITPADNTNRVLVRAVLSVATNSGAVLQAQLVRGATVIGTGAAASLRTVAGAACFTGGSSEMQTMVLEWLDSPASASAQTYKVQFRASAAANVYLNRTDSDADAATSTRTASTITAIEVAT